VFKWMLRYFQGEMIRLEVLESYTLVLHMLGFWEKVGKGRRGWWGAGRKNGGGGGVKNVWPQRKESEWCCAFSTGLWAGWLAGLKVQEVWASSGFLPKCFFPLFLPSSLLTRTLLLSA